MLVVTTPIIEGRKIQEYKGPVFAQVTRGIGALRGFTAGWKSMTGGRSKMQEQSFIEIREIALNEIVENAKARGANGIVGLVLDVEIITQKDSTIFLCKGYGTAVVLS
jgi:uncharacterized protein YbjQ (UPF0145 family)